MNICELGGGDNPVYCKTYANGINVDVRQLNKVDVVASFEEPLPLPTNEFDLVFSKFVIEHISWRKMNQFISEVYRILRPEGKVIVITANLLEQAKVLVSKPIWDGSESNLIFGGQDHIGNFHKCGLSPAFAEALFKKAGFSNISVTPLQECSTDMKIEAIKNTKPNTNSYTSPYTRTYFEDGTIGYYLYQDFPSHHILVEKILERKPESVLDIGGARGYVVKKLIARGITAVCMDMSEHCVPRNTLIYSKDSIDRVQDIGEKRFLLGHDGLLHQNTKVFCRDYDGLLRKIQVAGYPDPIRITPEHPILAVRSRKTYKRPSRINEWEPIWIPAEELLPHDYVALAIPSEEIDRDSIVKPIKGKKDAHHIPDEVFLSYAFMELVGYYLSEGTTSSYGVKFCFNIEETEYVKAVRDLLWVTVGLESSEQVNLNLHQRNVQTWSLELVELMVHYFGHTASGKRLPWFFMQLPLSKQARIVKTMWNGDGWVGIQKLRGKEYARASWASNSETLALQLRIILLRLGITNSLQRYDAKKPNHQPSYHIKVTDYDSVCKLCEILERPKPPKPNKTFRKIILKNRLLYQYVRNISTENYTGKVYNFEVESSNSYTLINATIHNCWHTRATDSFVLHDATVAPYPFKDKQFDLCVTTSVLEHIEESKLETLMKEMARVCKRGYHHITFEKTSIDIDITHKTFRPREWWLEKFKQIVPDFPVEIDASEAAPIVDGHMTTYIRLPETVKPDGLVKLNIGSFINMYHFGWENIDVLDLEMFAKQNGYVFKRLDVVQGSMPNAENSVDIIVASHFVEHLSRAEGEKFLRECLRVLKPEGILRLGFPDAKTICNKYVLNEIKEYAAVNIGVEKASDDAQALFELLLQGHKTFYDAESVKKLLEKCGFVKIEQMPFGKTRSKTIEYQTVDMYPTLSAYVEAQKDILTTQNSSVSTEKKLTVGIISTPFLRTPPDSYGGTEQIVADLAETLAELGHQVTVFAANGSKVKGCKIVEFGEPKLKVQVDWLKAEREAYEIYKQMLKEFDIIHGNDWLGFEYAAKAQDTSLKVLHTHHGGLNLEWWKRGPFPPFKLNLVAISQFMSKVYEAQGFSSKYAYNGINLERYPFQEEKGERLLFVGRIDSFKAPHVAIEVAKRLNVGLDIVGGTFVQDPAYLENIKKQCDGTQIKFHPDVPHEQKVKLMQDAKCLIFPSQMGEPFGLVACEAMATGTPVIALNDGAIEEIVQEGGVVCQVFRKSFVPQRGIAYDVIADPVDLICKEVRTIQIAPELCRKNAEKFDRLKMANTYLWLYSQVLNKKEW